MKRTLFLDRDGTLVEPRHYPSKPADLVLSAGIGPVLRTFQVAGWELIVVTNQSDLARGYFTEGDLTRMHDAITDEVITLPEELQHSHTTVLVSDSKTIGRFANCPSTLATPNQQEAWRAVDPDVAPAQPVDLELAHVLGRKLRGMLRTSTIAVTVADRGVLLTGPDSGQSHVPCQPTACASDVGAGDTFIAAAAMAPAAGAPAEQAVRIGIDAASIAITH